MSVAPQRPDGGEGGGAHAHAHPPVPARDHLNPPARMKPLARTPAGAGARRRRPTLRRMREDDLDAVLEMERIAFDDIPKERLWKPEQVLAHVRAFPEGQWVAELDGRVVGSCMNLRTTWARATAQHTWREITARGSLATHDPEGDVLYGTEVMVHPDARRRGVGRMLFERRYAYVAERGMRAFVTGGRLPGYARHAERLTPWGYVQAVARGELSDPVLTPELKWGMAPLGVLCGYMVDPPSLHHATLVAWENPDFSRDDGQAT